MSKKRKQKDKQRTVFIREIIPHASVLNARYTIELYEALRALVEAWETNQSGGFPNNEIGNARAALAKVQP